MMILCILWDAPKRGEKTQDLAGWVGEIGKSTEEVRAAIEELKTRNVGSIVTASNGEVTVISRRMVRDQNVREQNRLRKRRHDAMRPHAV